MLHLQKNTESIDFIVKSFIMKPIRGYNPENSKVTILCYWSISFQADILLQNSILKEIVKYQIFLYKSVIFKHVLLGKYYSYPNTNTA